MRRRPSKSRRPASALPPPGSPPPAGWRVRALAGALAIACPIAGLVVCEIGLRAFGYGYRPDFFLRIDGAEAYTTNPKYGWRFFPRTIARTPVVCRMAAPKPPGTYRIFVLGESAAMGVPEPAFSFGRLLGAMLGERYPGVRFEIVNAAMTAINSHVIVGIARECAHYEPDLFLVYMGNNEVVGPWGPQTVFTRRSPSRTLIQTGIRLRATRTGQLAANLLSRETGPREWGGMAMFLDRVVPFGDPALEKVYGDFRANLEEICRLALSSGARVVLSTVAVNLRDNPPFASVHGSGFSPAGKDRWEAIYQSANEIENTGHASQALEKYLEAAALDDRFAELHYRAGRCLVALGRFGEARKSFVLARDLDALRFRADSAINGIIRETAARLAPQKVCLLDAESAFERSAENGIPGEALFYEHVHPTFAGNYVLAKAALETSAPGLPEWVRRRESRAPPATLERMVDLVALTAWDRYRMTAEMFALMGQPPFINQLEARERSSRRERQLIALKQDSASPEALRQSRARLQAAVGGAPGDLESRVRYATLLRECGDHGGAAEQWSTLVRLVPGIAQWHASFGDALRDQGKLEEALREHTEALRLDPELATAHFGLGSVEERQGKLDEAGAQYREALRLKPNYAEAHNNLGALLSRRGQLRQAVEHYEVALRIKPDFAQGHNNLGVALAALGETSQAIAHYSAALRIEPDYAEAHYSLAVALAGLGQTGPAIDHYEEAVRIRPGYAEAHHNLGTALARQGKTGQALAHLSAAVGLKPHLAEPHFNLGVVLERMGRLQEAAQQYSEAVRLNPSFSPARQRLAGVLLRQPHAPDTRN